MTWRNATGFLTLGLAMLWLPDVAPQLMAPSPAFGFPSTRELWLLFMGSLNASLGGGTLLWHAMQQAWRLPVWLAPAPVPQARPALRPALRAPARVSSY